MKLKILWLRWRTHRLARQERNLEREITRLNFRLDMAIRDKSSAEVMLAKAETKQGLATLQPARNPRAFRPTYLP